MNSLRHSVPFLGSEFCVLRSVFGFSILTALLLSTPLLAAGPPPPDPRVHTYSIVALDRETGELGVAVQSHWFSVGTIVTWAEAGVGAIATQSFAEPSYGPLGLELMRAGRTSEEALRALVSTDEGRDVRQVAMIDAKGRVAAHTGSKCIAAAGHHVGPDYSVQANLMRSDAVWPAMADAFEKTPGDLAERMLAALEAAEKAGGDIRGRQSAALLVVRGKPSGKPWSDRRFDLRVDDSPNPLPELRRLVNLQRAYEHMNRGDELAAEEKWEEALAEYSRATDIAPGIEEFRYWVAVTLFSAGREEEALPIFRDVFAANADWVEVTRRLPASGLLPDDPIKLQKILAMAKTR